MPLGALSLAVSTGVHGREFKARINGLTTGRTEVLAEGAPGFDVVNGFLVNSNLPGTGYRPLTAVVRELEPGGSPSFRDTRLAISAFDQGEVRAQALTLVNNGRQLRRFGSYAETLGDGSLAWKVFAEDDLGAIYRSDIGTTPTPAPGAPVNDPANPPSIEGPATDGATLTFRMGLWPTATSFDIAVIDVADGSTILPRQPVSGDTNSSISALGKTVRLVVWGKNATDPVGTNSAVSAPFGPIVAAGDQLILAIILKNGAAGTGGTQTINGIPFIELTGTYADNLYDGVNRQVPGFPGLFYGFVGTAAGATALATVGGTNPTDVRFRGRWGVNSNAGSLRFRCDLPASGVYRVYSGNMLGSAAVGYNLGIFDNANATAGVGTANGGYNGAALTNSGSIRDATGAPFDNADRNVNVTNWAAESGPGGDPAEVTMATNAMALARHPDATVAPQLNVFAIYKKA